MLHLRKITTYDWDVDDTHFTIGYPMIKMYYKLLQDNSLTIALRRYKAAIR